ncbi:alpha/beta hydrolase [Calothrix sp. CCY 0018]|uniref:alpha/beta hydrolase n=1 Tax=Calothrix sp. CCY 0018 TaxID=3103864 RepID=UPI0039C6FF1B
MQIKQKLDWKIRLLDKILNLQKPLHKMDEEELRIASVTPIPSITQRIFAGKKFQLPKIEQKVITGRHGEIPIQIYYPCLNTNLPVILFFHGGGWIHGNFPTYDFMCRRIAKESNSLVIAVNYKLAPQFKYPTALEDCFDALTWVSENINPQQLTVMGDSAGGNLAAALCLMLRDRKQNLNSQLINKQILIYPVLDATLSKPSMEYNDAPLLTKEAMQFYVNCYSRSDSDIHESYFSPLLAEDLSNLPPTLIIAAEYDVLHDENLLYAQRLQAANNQVKLIDYPRMVHGFLSFPPFCSKANNAFIEIANYVKASAV